MRLAAVMIALALLAGTACSDDGRAEARAARAALTALPRSSTSVRSAVGTVPASPDPGLTTTTATATTVPTSTATEEPPRTRLVISGAGDTNLDPGYLPVFRAEGYEHAFSAIGRTFTDDDLTIVNLECAATTGGAPAAKTFVFNCDLDALPVLRQAGVEVVNLANNHAADYGEDALLDTRRNVLAADLAPVGVGVDADAASQPAVFEINGWTVAVLGFNGVVPWADWIATDDSPGAADGDNAETMAAAVARADELADLVLVTVHWGVELDLEPRADDIERAEAMIDAGADAIFGHHPHRLQALEFYRGRPIAWSLGNFVWPRLSALGSTTAIAQVVVEPDGTVDACLVPVIIESDGHPVVQGHHDPTDPCPVSAAPGDETG